MKFKNELFECNFNVICYNNFLVASPSVECKSKHRTSDLKMHIKKSQNSFGVNKANTDEYRLDDSSVKLNGF